MASRTHECTVVAVGLTMSSVDTSAAYFYCFAVPQPTIRPRPILAAVAVGLIEAIALVLYGLSIVVYEQGGETTGISGSGADLAPVILIALFIVFAALVLLVTWMLSRGRRAARTPFLMVQAFAVVVAQPLVAEPSTRVLGGLVLLAVVVGAVTPFTSSAREFLK